VTQILCAIQFLVLEINYTRTVDRTHAKVAEPTASFRRHAEVAEGMTHLSSNHYKHQMYNVNGDNCAYIWHFSWKSSVLCY